MNLTPDITLSVLFFVKYALIAFLILYLIFATIVVKQVRVMNKTLDVGFESSLVLLSFIHLTLAVFVLFLALFLL